MTLFNLEKRVAFIAGGNGGIGLGMAKGFASSDAAVVIAGEIEQGPIGVVGVAFNGRPRMSKTCSNSDGVHANANGGVCETSQ